MFCVRPDPNDGNQTSNTPHAPHTPKIDLPKVELVIPNGCLNYPPSPAPSSPRIPPHKQLMKDITKLTQENVNVSDLMKNDSISCSSLSGFLTFYQTLEQQLFNCNVFI